ncbi:MAG: PEP-CTERM sorting domain-containing protein [Luteolibacter sp.]
MANGGAYWLVEEAGDFFTLMAFAVSEPGTRTGDFTITLSYLGTDVYWESLTGVETQEVHVGTNEITLVQGLAFDRMRLDFELISAVELESLAADPMDLQPIPTTLNGILPIFGAPESNRFSPGIVYVVPEPSSLMLLSLALGMGLGRRRR